MQMNRLFLLLKNQYLIVICFFLLCSIYASRIPSNPWNRPIVSDGKGYYAYLPAIFIYQDFTYGFTEDMEEKYYPSDKSLAKGFVKTINGKSVNQYFIGLAVLWSPFFLIAHFLSYLLGYSADGYSILYQFSIIAASIIYVYIGLRTAHFVLKQLKFSTPVTILSIISLIFGTNLFHYSADAPSLSHVYSFSIIAAFTALLFRLKNNFQPLLAMAVAMLFGLIILVRPTNGLVALMIPFVIGSPKAVTTLFFQNWKTWLIAFLSAICVLGIQPLIWKLQADQWFLYSYAEEGFNFDSPQIVNLLFSIRKGWFIYTPLAFIALLGWVPLFRQHRFRAYSLLLLLIIVIYVVSCWHLWAYGDSFGQRPLVDYYICIAILLGFVLTHVKQASIYLKIAMGLVLISCIVLNQVQSVQIRKGIISGDHMTIEKYQSSFFQLVPNSTIQIDTTNLNQISQAFNNIEFKKPGWLNWQNTSSSEQSFSGKLSSKLSGNNEYGISFNKEGVSNDTRVIIGSAMIYAEKSSAKPFLIFDLQQKDGTSIEYFKHQLSPFMRRKKWFPIHFSSTITQHIPENSRLICYFWYPESKSAVFVDDFKITTYSNLK